MTHNVHEHGLFDLLDALVQARFGVVIEHLDGALGKDPAGVDSGIDFDDARAGDFHAMGEGITHAVCTRE